MEGGKQSSPGSLLAEAAVVEVRHRRRRYSLPYRGSYWDGEVQSRAKQLRMQLAGGSRGVGEAATSTALLCSVSKKIRKSKRRKEKSGWR